MLRKMDIFRMVSDMNTSGGGFATDLTHKPIGILRIRIFYNAS